MGERGKRYTPPHSGREEEETKTDGGPEAKGNAHLIRRQGPLSLKLLPKQRRAKFVFKAARALGRVVTGRQWLQCMWLYGIWLRLVCIVLCCVCPTLPPWLFHQGRQVRERSPPVVDLVTFVESPLAID